MTSIFYRGVVVIFCIVALLDIRTAAAEGKIYPGERWEIKTANEVGLDAAKLEALSNFIGGRGCVVRHGCMVYTWGDQSKRGDVASAAKPWYSHFLFKALEDGRISGLDEKVSKWEPRLNIINKDLGYKDRDITLRHMANQISCYGVTEPPGTAYAYNDWQMALFWDTVFLKVYGSTYEMVDEQVLHPQLTDILECEDNPTFMAFGVKDRAGRLAVSVRDFARFGLLYLHRGNWKGRQLISREHAAALVTTPLHNTIPRSDSQEGSQGAEMISGQRTMGSQRIPDNQTDHFGSYSWLWWTNGVDRNGKRHWADAPLDAFGGFGHGGRRAMAVIPSLDIIVSWNDADIKGGEMENKALKLLVEAVKSPDPPLIEEGVSESAAQDGQIIVDPNHPQWLKYKKGGPFFMAGPGDPEDFLYRGKLNPDGTRNGDQTALINKLKGTGANCIYLMAVRSHGGDGEQTHNPFIDNDPTKKINMKVLDQWESWFAEMDKNGIVIYFFFYDDDALVWDTGDKMGKEEKYFIHTLVNRFEHHKHLIWCVAEEYEEAFSAARVKNIAAEIRSADDYDHIIAVHKLPGLDFSEFKDDPNIEQFAIQYEGSIDTLHDGMVTAWQNAAGQYNLNMSEVPWGKTGTGAESRIKSWAMVMGGAYVMVNGMDIESTDVSDLEDMGRIVRFFESTNFYEMAPHDELKYGGTDYVLAKQGDSYVAYALNLSGDIGLKDMSAGTYNINWFDCVTGKSIAQNNVKVGAGVQTFSKPAGIGSELAVYIKRID